MPPLGDRDRPRGGVVGGGGYDDELFEGSGDVNSRIKNYAARAGEDLEIYDFGGLRQDLEEDDGLADQLIEENDDLNDVTFSVDVRKDGQHKKIAQWLIHHPCLLNCFYLYP